MRVHHRVPRDDLALGLLRVEGVSSGPAPAALERALTALCESRHSGPLSVEQERRRQACRALLKNGRYRATGRGKPASEYLLREATLGSFPRLAGPVDANNLVSLEQLVPISLWDLELAERLLCPVRPSAQPQSYQADLQVEVRLGRPGESYVFNAGGQSLGLEDLVCGCVLDPEGSSRPIVTPVKDSLATKLTVASRCLAGCIYYPLVGGSREELVAITEGFLRWLCACGEGAQGSFAVALPGEHVSV